MGNPGGLMDKMLKCCFKLSEFANILIFFLRCRMELLIRLELIRDSLLV